LQRCSANNLAKTKNPRINPRIFIFDQKHSHTISRQRTLSLPFCYAEMDEKAFGHTYYLLQNAQKKFPFLYAPRHLFLQEKT
jgi:hypothetical protein